MELNGNKIKQLRETRMWSQEQLAQLAGIGLRTVQRIESGGQAAPDTVKALAVAFEVDSQVLLVDEVEDELTDDERALEAKRVKGVQALRMSFYAHGAGYLVGGLTFTGISLLDGAPGFAMAWPLFWWTVGFVSHGVTVGLVELVSRTQAQGAG